MQIINGDTISKMCSYSFGDQAGVLMGIPGAFMKKANGSNREFLRFCKGKEHLTLFIDNIRLYNRPTECKEEDKGWIESLQQEDLLALCATLPNKFIIYTSHEDTPIDEYISFFKIPVNVLKIYATNAIYNDGKVIPF